MSMRLVWLLVLFLLAANAGTVLAAPDQRGLSARPKAPTGEEVKGDLWLVTIGINYYLNWPRLKTAVNDAKAVKETLLKRYHLDPARVVELTDEKATRKNILAAFRDLARKVKPDDSLLVYYAGHGHIDSITGKGSWIPVESGTDDPSAWISNRDITDYRNINAIKARHVLLVSDSCFSGDFFRGNRGALPTINDAFLKKAYTRSSRQAISSGGLEPVSDAGFGGNSVFSHFLVAALNNNRNPYLIPSEIFSEIKSGVGKNASQLPQFGDLHGTGGQDGGELILFLKGSTGTRLQDMGVTSAARQKELEQLKKMEAEAAATKAKEQQEIARKQAELDALDKQIAEMKGRLGTSAARSNDNLNSILAMVEQKETQAKRLEELRKQRDAEELKRQQEIERLKQEAITQRHNKIADNVAKFQKIVQSPYGKDLKDSAWDALIANYPEAKNIARYDLDGFLALQGLGLDKGDIITLAEKMQRVQQRREFENRIAGEMVLVKGGCFEMGGKTDFGRKGEYDTFEHEVCLSDFRIGKYEVTRGQWNALMGQSSSEHALWLDNNPINNVSWNDAQLFIQKLNLLNGKHYRLPTEAEWEYACRSGGKDEKYCGSDDFDSIAHDWFKYEGGTTVGLKKANGLGIYDMTGNVGEWVQDTFERDYYSKSPRENPKGPGYEGNKVVRGTVLGFAPQCVGSRCRWLARPPDKKDKYVGFRLAAPVE
ncbi:MAG: SUMF1/EgtB/PvdO family nonheme iron enzyme [Geobacteraceae bacterium]|nr:SUMF1/EgtB/PvdO family nonheme iron enzyme [Geobacteraceae bacterium]